MKTWLQRPFRWLRLAATSWAKHKDSRMAAALAYYTVFAIAPLLIIVTAMAGVVFGKTVMRARVLDQVASLVGRHGAGLVGDMMAAASRSRATLLATIIGVATILLGASGIFAQLQDALNTIWEVAPRQGAGWRPFLRRRFLSFSMVLVIGFLLMVSLMLSAMVSATSSSLTRIWPDWPRLLWLVDAALGFVTTTALFAALFKVLPDVRVRWREVWIGALVTATLFSGGRALIGVYLGRSSLSSAYGAAGSLVVILVWIYYSAQILLLGCEFTRVHARENGQPVVCKAGVAPVTQDARAQQGMVAPRPA